LLGEYGGDPNVQLPVNERFGNSKAEIIGTGDTSKGSLERQYFWDLVKRNKKK
jgi:hypothetical protein